MKVLKKKLLVLLSLLFAGCGESAYHKQLELLYGKDVARIMPDSLAELMEQEKDLVVLDTRSLKEREVSYIPGSTFITYEDADLDQLDQLDKNKPIVVYCTVGYRSEKVGKKLQEKGFRDVRNLYGGIIEWKNKGYNLINQQQEETDSVHTYDRYWGMFLKKGVGIYE